jgi:hypothetical protein
MSRALTLASLVVFLSRVPWLGHDFGSDPDSYRIVATGRLLARTGTYQASILPGYPVYEYRQR